MATTLPGLSGTAPQLPPGVSSHYVMVGDIRTHYLEAGQGEPIILLHSAEFGGRAEFSWRYTIPALAEHFHVYAPDIVGFGRTAKLYNFSDPTELPRGAHASLHGHPLPPRAPTSWATRSAARSSSPIAAADPAGLEDSLHRLR